MARKLALIVWSAVAFAVWAGAAISTVVQKMNADKTIRNATDISAVQIQQLNGSVTAHALAALLLAGAATIPLLIIGVNALVSHWETSTDWRTEATED